MKTEWICTDPDTEQYGRQISERVFEFKEKCYLDEGSSDDNVIQIVIDLSNYTDYEMEDYTSSYYNSLEEIEEIYGEEANWIIAECIFEQESGNY